MKLRILVQLLALLLPATIPAAGLQYVQDVTKWKAVLTFSNSLPVDWAVWSDGALFSEHYWRVLARDGDVAAQLRNEIPEQSIERPSFTPEIKESRAKVWEPSAFAKVMDGWLVGFNGGEFGGALYWFARDGKSSYKISDHQVIECFSISNRIYAIEGLEHFGFSRGSVISIFRAKNNEHWQAGSFATLPLAPYAVSVRHDGTMLITLSKSLVSVDNRGRVQTILSQAPWGGLDPDSSVLSLNEEKIYIGMRQFVGEFDLVTKRLRLLVPSGEFLNIRSKREVRGVNP